jgi:hypothetical protein
MKGGKWRSAIIDRGRRRMGDLSVEDSKITKLER